MKIVCLGDSLTYGYGVPRKDTWIRLSAERTGWELINKGMNGDTTGGMLARFHTEVIAEKPKFVFLMGGSNDIIMSGNVQAAKCNINAMVHQAFGNQILPIVGIPFPCYLSEIRQDWAEFADFRGVSGVLREYREWLLKFSKAFGALAVDFYPAFEEIIRRPDAAEYFIDGLHLTPKGHEVMADVFCEAMAAIVKGVTPC